MRVARAIIEERSGQNPNSKQPQPRGFDDAVLVLPRRSKDKQTNPLRLTVGRFEALLR